MSKKLIAVASAAALALTALVGVAPASASVTATVSGSDSGSGTAAAPYLESVPTANILDAATSVAVDVTTAVGDVMTVTATGSVRILDVVTGATAGALYNAASGKTTYTATATGTTTSFIAYSTSTTAGTFQISLKSATASASGSPIYLKGVAGAMYNINVTAPSTLAAGATGEITMTATDLFGNVIENDATTSTAIASADSVAGVGTLPTLGAATWDATRKVYVASLSAVSTATSFAYILSGSVTDVDGLAKANDSGFWAINSAGVSAQVSALTAQVAALTADYNKLAKRWNKLNKNNRAPKKNVALK